MAPVNFLQFFNTLLLNVNICKLLTAFQIPSPQSNETQSNWILAGMHVSILYTKIKGRKATRKTILQCATNVLVSLPALIKQNPGDIVLGLYKGYPAHVWCTSIWKLSHRTCKEREREQKREERKPKNAAAQDFPHCFFVNYGSKKPPTLHHVGKNQSQTGTYLWTLLLPERNSSYSEKKKKQPIECVAHPSFKSHWL